MHILMIQYFLEMLYVLDNIDEFFLFSGPLIIDANDFLILTVLLLIASLLDFELVVDLLDSPQALDFLFGIWEEQLNLIPGINEEILINLVLLDLIIIVVDLGFLWNDTATVPNLLEDVCVLPRVLFNFWRNFLPSLSFSILLLYVNLNQDEHVRDQEVNGLARALQLIRSDGVVQELHLPVKICTLLLVCQLRLEYHAPIKQSFLSIVIVELVDPEPAELLSSHDVLLNAEVLLLEEVLFTTEFRLFIIFLVLIVLSSFLIHFIG